VLQMAPFLLRYFLFEDSTNNVPTTDSSIILRLFTVLAEITIMVYMTRIDKPDEWAIRFNMLAGELVSLFEKWNLIGLEPKVNIAVKPNFTCFLMLASISTALSLPEIVILKQKNPRIVKLDLNSF